MFRFHLVDSFYDFNDFVNVFSDIEWSSLVTRFHLLFTEAKNQSESSSQPFPQSEHHLELKESHFHLITDKSDSSRTKTAERQRISIKDSDRVISNSRSDFDLSAFSFS